MTSFPEPTELPAPTPRAMPPVQAQVPAPATSPAAQPSPAAPAAPAAPAPATPASPGTMRGPYATSLGVGGPPPGPIPAAGVAAAARAVVAGAASAGLGSAMREEVWAIVRAAVEEAMGPLVARQRELEARMERAERAPQLASIPVAFGASVAPPAVQPAPPPRLPRIDVAPAQSSVTEPGGATIRDLKAAPAYEGGGSATQPNGKKSIAPSGYGVTVSTAPRPSLDLAHAGPVDIDGFDGGARKRRVASAVVVIMLLIVAGVVTMTVLSHS